MITVAAIVNCAVSENEISCESFGVFGNKSCILGETEINSANTVIAERDETVEAMWMHNNQKASYLPNKLAEKFPNIVLYQADRCSIKEISRDNFWGLNSLRELDLNDNQIESLKDGTFEGLLNLHFLRLSILLSHYMMISSYQPFHSSENNKIRKLKATSFGMLPSLEYLDLRLNACIDEDFIGRERIENVRNFPRTCKLLKVSFKVPAENEEQSNT